MASDTAPAAAPGPADPPTTTNPAPIPDRGFLASLVAPIEPARPTTFSIDPTNIDGPQTAAADGVVDRSAPGVSSSSFRDATQDAARTSDPSGTRAKRSVWKELMLAAATRWAKGGGTANKRLDLQKAKAQANQIKEVRTTTVTRSGGLPVRNSGGSGAGAKDSPKKSGRDSANNGPVNSSGNRSGGTGHGGSGGGRGSSGGHGSAGGSGSHSGRGPHRNGGTGQGPGGSGAGGGRGSQGPRGRDHASTPGGGTPRGNGAGGSGGSGSQRGAHDRPGGGRDGRGSPKNGPGSDSGTGGQGGSGNAGRPGGAGGSGAAGGTGPSGSNGGGRGGRRDAQRHGSTDTAADNRTPLQRSRDTGHGDGSAVRNAVDHVVAYGRGAVDGWEDTKDANAKEHDRLDKARQRNKDKAKDDAEKTGDQGKQPDTGKPKDDKTTSRDITAADGSGRTVVIVAEEGDDGVSTDIKPLMVKDIDARTLTLGTDGAKGSISRKELRNFKQYEGKLTDKETYLHKIAEACRQLEKEAENEAKDCQELAEQAKSVEGGESVVTELNKLAEAAKNQAVEAGQLAAQAQRAAEYCKVVLTNIGDRYAPLYQAVVDSPEIKPAEMRFYNDRGHYATAA